MTVAAPVEFNNGGIITWPWPGWGWVYSRRADRWFVAHIAERPTALIVYDSTDTGATALDVTELMYSGTYSHWIPLGPPCGDPDTDTIHIGETT